MIAVKAQVHAGGRARAGGVAIVDSPAKAKSAAEQMLGNKLVTEQTGPVGRVTKRVYVERGIRGIRDLMIALLVDEKSGELTLIASSQGGQGAFQSDTSRICRLGEKLPKSKSVHSSVNEATGHSTSNCYASLA